TRCPSVRAVRPSSLPPPSEVLLSGNDACLDRQLVDRAGQRFTRDLLVGVAQLEQHSAGLDVGHPPLRRTLARTHPGFGGLLGQRTIREDVDPHLAATLDVPVDGDTSGLDLTVGDVGVLQRLDAVVAEAHRRAAAGNPALARVVLLAVLDSAGNQHDSALRTLRLDSRRLNWCRSWRTRSPLGTRRGTPGLGTG